MVPVVPLVPLVPMVPVVPVVPTVPVLPVASIVPVVPGVPIVPVVPVLPTAPVVPVVPIVPVVPVAPLDPIVPAPFIEPLVSVAVRPVLFFCCLVVLPTPLLPLTELWPLACEPAGRALDWLEVVLVCAVAMEDMVMAAATEAPSIAFNSFCLFMLDLLRFS